ncbi:hypothetical protein [Sporichthya sp.]|uniref:hypothetical protein n=1 Tax=Sporichthya sp. TaxID=65475 RepID=UPI00182406DC|nr:hypothetical protein [Sporichthya sp.]MBA3742758.1 hypothetical protein [Sporichthya sp.]
MAARRVVLALVAALALTGCGGSDDAPDAAAAEATIASVSASPTANADTADKPGKAGKGMKGASAAATVAPEIVVPTTSDAVSAQTLGGWQGLVVAELRKVEPRLVTTDGAAVKKIRATCVQMQTGMFETKVVPIIIKRFSTAQFTPTYELGQQVYSILLQYACYRMNETPKE